MFNNIKEIFKIFFANDKNKISNENRKKVIGFLNNPNNIFNKGEIDSVRDVFDLKDSEIMPAIKKNIKEFGIKKNNRDSIIYNKSTENN